MTTGNSAGSGRGEVELPLRPLIEAILRRYHTTRISDDAVEFILFGPIVRVEFERLFDALRARQPQQPKD